MASKTHDEQLGQLEEAADARAAAEEDAAAELGEDGATWTAPPAGDGVLVPTETYPPGAAPAARAQLAPTLGNLDAAELEQLLAPATMDYATWLRSIITDERLEDSDPEEAGVGILAAILLAETSAAALSALDLKRAKTLCGDTPGGISPMLEITGARGMVSSYEEGAPAYAIVQAIVLDTGERIQFTTGARAVQAVILKHIGEGWMPFRARLAIRRMPTKRGYYPLNLQADG